MMTEAQQQIIGRLEQQRHALMLRAEAVGVRKLIAVIGDSRNAGSIALHRLAGFEQVGVLHSCGWKFDQWLDIVMMERALGPGNRVPPSPQR